MVNKTSDPECDFVFGDVKVLNSGSYDEWIIFVEIILLKYGEQNLNTCEPIVCQPIVYQPIVCQPRVLSCS